jgi:hypothetical protein
MRRLVPLAVFVHLLRTSTHPPPKLELCLFPCNLPGFTGRLGPSALFCQLLFECHLPGFLSWLRRLPQSQILLAPKPLFRGGVQRNQVWWRVGVLLVAALRLDVLTGWHLLLGAWLTSGAMAEFGWREMGGEREDNGDENAGGTTWAGSIY